MTDLDPAYPARVVVVGAGLAGLRTIEELRGRGYQGAITLVGAEQRLPYDRPPLSKKLMMGALEDTTLRTELESLAVEVRLGERATGLGDGVLMTDAGRVLFKTLVLATGANPVTLPGQGRQHVLRTVDDALELRKLLAPGTALAIVGAGWIGAELATAAAGLGCRVTVLEAGQAPVAAAVGPEVGAATIPWYAAAGVDLRLGQGVDEVAPGGLALAGGEWLPADVVVTAIGVRPAVAWLDGSGIELENGIAVDGQLRTSVPGVFAVGDCAAFWSGRYGRRLRFEHWDVALHAPAVVAANIVGGSEAYDPVPYFWSEQFGRMVQYVGFHGSADQLVWRGDPAAEKWAAAWLAGDRLVALLTVGRPRDLLQGRRVIEAGAPVDPARLADPAVAVRDSVLR
ncbi:MAG TPA: FAD-dependent oxidoreductase [Streptosporangiaceae bacterium]|nr:FAD-dependent oxidoreductase [Streptosporangiaceae bacterium]